jgi:hypothetical protein
MGFDRPAAAFGLRTAKAWNIGRDRTDAAFAA